jgi:hypothetical protein
VVEGVKEDDRSIVTVQGNRGEECREDGMGNYEV